MDKLSMPQKREQASAPSTPPKWSNDPPKTTVPHDMDAEMKTPTPRETQLADLAEKNKSVTPRKCNITNKNTKALRVVHDFHGQAVTLRPNETKRDVLLHPTTAEYLSRKGSDIDLD